MKRTFIAVPLVASEILLSLLGDLRREMAGEDIKWVEPENLHITLKFLGDTAENQLNPVMEKLDRVCTTFRKQSGKLSGLASFSKQGNPSVLFSKLIELPGLENMADAIDRELEVTGFVPEQRKFRPHLTLARIKMLRDKRKFFDLMNFYKMVEIQSVDVNRVVFYESILQPRGPIYKSLKTIELR